MQKRLNNNNKNPRRAAARALLAPRVSWRRSNELRLYEHTPAREIIISTCRPRGVSPELSLAEPSQ